MGRKPSAAAAAAAAVEDEALVATMPADLLAAANCGGVHGHSLFFDALVQLIPPRFYLPSGDEDRPWYQGLSKAAKAAMKAQSRANVKAARRARLDPSAPPASTLDLLKKSVADQAAEEEDEDDEENSGEESAEVGDEASSEDEDDDDEIEEEDEDGDEMPIAPAAVVSEDRSVTYEELQERLQRRIAELRGNRCTRPEFLNKPKKEKGKKPKRNNEKRGKGEGKKRKREDGTDDAEGKDGKKAKKALEKPDIMYANVVVDPKEARRRKKRRIKNKKKELERAKRLQEAKQDPGKANKIAWDTARRRAAGEKVHDDPKLIKESLKKEEKRQQKHAAQWKERQKTVDKQRKEKQKKRTENIRERAHQKKMRKIEKREKKLMRPGFEGRKDGYVNE
ncbi:ribosomal RNA-processing protein 14-like [Panicum miliaceum]|uniref:Ribosomal RNA-processing protein 14-like n=1 Tax=Panicum miliaceum TaxID=4540 RepID=A0A3L6RRY0_PANMI|nr:ribosomal RNA-processing protein 14-like [Panicum miliaceum]